MTPTTERLYASGRQQNDALATARLASSGSLCGSERRLCSEGNSRDKSRGFLSPRDKRCGGLRRVAPPWRVARLRSWIEWIEVVLRSNEYRPGCAQRSLC
ncbi:hypothetical protein OD547_000195 [Salmonella enterica]|nr:hypothetical protein [Salmonella enterica]